MLTAVLCCVALGFDLGAPLPKAFSHNDYVHDRPLAQAMENGFTHVEADVFLVDGKLLVAHERQFVKPAKNLRDLYLEPLWNLYRSGKGRIYPTRKEPFWLMIDIKEDGAAVYEALKQELLPYRKMLCSWTDARRSAGAVAIVLSGDRPVDVVAKERKRLVAIDGRPSDLDTNPPVGLVPWVSDSWSDLFKWTGDTAPTPALRTQVEAYIAKAHKQGRQVRFWEIPDSPESWKFQEELGIDMINTDRLVAFRKWASGG